eukprot:Gb_34124 [translate_table: standard]
MNKQLYESFEQEICIPASLVISKPSFQDFTDNLEIEYDDVFMRMFCHSLEGVVENERKSYNHYLTEFYSMRRNDDERHSKFNKRFWKFYLSMPTKIHPSEVAAKVYYIAAQRPNFSFYLRERRALTLEQMFIDVEEIEDNLWACGKLPQRSFHEGIHGESPENVTLNCYEETSVHRKYQKSQPPFAPTKNLHEEMPVQIENVAMQTSSERPIELKMKDQSMNQEYDEKIFVLTNQEESVVQELAEEQFSKASHMRFFSGEPIHDTYEGEYEQSDYEIQIVRQAMNSYINSYNIWLQLGDDASLIRKKWSFLRVWVSSGILPAFCQVDNSEVARKGNFQTSVPSSGANLDVVPRDVPG